MDEKKEEKKPKSKVQKVLNIIMTVLLVILAVVGILSVVHVKTAKDPSIFGYSIFVVSSGSMRPTLREGDVLLVKKMTDPSTLQKGDIITFHGRGQHQGKIVTHRIISNGVEEDGSLLTCGDANNGIADDPITFNDVIGKVVHKSAFLYFLYSAFTNKIGFVLIVFLPLLILLIVQVVNFVRACKMNKDGKVEGEEPEETKEETDQKLIEEYLKRRKQAEEEEKRNKKDGSE